MYAGNRQSFDDAFVTDSPSECPATALLCSPLCRHVLLENTQRQRGLHWRRSRRQTQERTMHHTIGDNDEQSEQSKHCKQTCAIDWVTARLPGGVGCRIDEAAEEAENGEEAVRQRVNGWGVVGCGGRVRL